MTRARHYASMALASAVWLHVVSARADAPSDREPSRIEDAAEAYDAGRMLAAKKDYALAAQFFARADELARSDVALEEALKAAILGDAGPLALELAERAERAARPSLSTRASEARARFKGRVGKVRLQCPTGQSCAMQIDGRPARNPAFVEAGEHAVATSAHGRTETRSVVVFPGRTSELDAPDAAPTSQVPPPAPAPAPAPAAQTSTPSVERRGLSPSWFWIGTAATGVAGALTALSLVDYLEKRNTFDADPSDQRAAAAGSAAETRTNVAIGVTGALAVATVVTGVWLVRWSDRAQVSACAGPGMAAMSAQVRFE